jgi:hypothetical protein
LRYSGYAALPRSAPPLDARGERDCLKKVPKWALDGVTGSAADPLAYVVADGAIELAAELNHRN